MSAENTPAAAPTYGCGTCARCSRRNLTVFWHRIAGAFFCEACLRRPV